MCQLDGGRQDKRSRGKERQTETERERMRERGGSGRETVQGGQGGPGFGCNQRNKTSFGKGRVNQDRIVVVTDSVGEERRNYSVTCKRDGI